MSLNRRLKSIETELAQIVATSDAKTQRGGQAVTAASVFQTHWANATHHGQNLARLIDGPVQINYRFNCPVDASTAENHAYYEVLRAAECCGQSYLRALAGVFAGDDGQWDEYSKMLAEWADHLDSLNIPDLSLYEASSKLPGNIGRSWQDKLAWALAIGKDNLAAELAKVKWFQCGSMYDLHVKTQAGRDYAERQGGFYKSPIPLNAVPPLPEWMTDYLREFPNPFPCEPHIYQDGTRLECR